MFVLQPLAEIAPAWRDPVTGLTVDDLRRRLAAEGEPYVPRAR
jgi:7,8-dihydro-6-hydroxymethylpterin-pyrophosphokinase